MRNSSGRRTNSQTGSRKGDERNELEAQLHEGGQTLARIWKATALRGILGIAFAVVILIWPGIGLSTLIALFGALALVDPRCPGRHRFH
jgi:small-conductance mechanosensitive channel